MSTGSWQNDQAKARPGWSWAPTLGPYIPDDLDDPNVFPPRPKVDPTPLDFKKKRYNKIHVLN
jgi:hypothetical protein